MYYDPTGHFMVDPSKIAKAHGGNYGVILSGESLTHIFIFDGKEYRFTSKELNYTHEEMDFDTPYLIDSELFDAAFGVETIEYYEVMLGNPLTGDYPPPIREPLKRPGSKGYKESNVSGELSNKGTGKGKVFTTKGAYSDTVYGQTGEYGTIYTCITSDAGSGIGALTEEQKQANAQYIFNYLNAKRWSKEVIAGLLENMERESGINPAEWQNLDKTGFGNGYGLVQWTPNKYAPEKFLKWKGLDAKKADVMPKNNPKELMDSQLKFLLITLNLEGSNEEKTKYGGEWIPTTKYGSPYKMTVNDYINSHKGAGELALVFHGSYERSEDSSKALKKRIESAQKWYNFLSK